MGLSQAPDGRVCSQKRAKTRICYLESGFRGGDCNMSPKNGGKSSQVEAGTEKSRPILHQKAREIQPYGKIAKLPIALDEKVCSDSVENLNQILADTITLRDMYKKHHWQV